jgi:hypothetical protein
MHAIKAFVFSQSASVDGFGQLMNKAFLIHIVIKPTSILSHFGGGGAPGGPDMLSNFVFMAAAEKF